MNCLTEIFFDEALDRAQELDAIFRRTGQITGGFHGLPISIKDSIDIEGKGYAATFAHWATMTAANDAAVVRVLRDEGAVFYVKTNNPQSKRTLSMTVTTSTDVYSSDALGNAQ